MRLDAVEAATRGVVDRGERLLHIHRFADTESGHLARLLQWAEIPPKARVIDLGCGTGEMARQWSRLRPDLDWVLVNLSPVQLAYAPATMRQHCVDMRQVPEEDGAFDVALCCFAIGHEDAGEVYDEMARLLTPGGVAFVYDMTCDTGVHAGVRQLDYAVSTREAMETAGRESGLRLDVYLEPTSTATHWVEATGHFAGTTPGIWRWIKP